MKKAIVIGMVLILMFFMLSSCGVSAEEYAKVSADLVAAQTEISGLQSELSAKEGEFQTMLSQLSDKESQLRTVQSQLSDKESELQSVQSQLEATMEKLEQGKAKMEVINGIWLPIMKGESPGGIDYFFEWRDQIIAVGDPVLTENFNEMLDTRSDEDLAKFFVHLFESMAESLE